MSGAPALFNIEGRVRGLDEVSRMFGMAPEQFRRTLLSWLLKERTGFVGGKDRGSQRDGVFRRQLMRKISNRGTPWEKRVARTFRGMVTGEKKIETMRLTMGAGIKGESKFVQGLRILGAGGSISSSNFMIVPVYRNLANKQRTYRQFRDMVRADKIVSIRSGGQVIYVDKERIDEGANIYEAAVFYGVKRISVPKEFDFEGDWMKRVPKVIERGQKAIDRVAKRIEKKNA